jgi:hypothetical protein
LLTVNIPTQYNLGAAESCRHLGFKPPSWEMLPSCTLTHWVVQSKYRVLVSRTLRAAVISFFCAFCFGRLWLVREGRSERRYAYAERHV